MIFVTVGTSSWDFKRLIINMDSIARDINDEVTMQIGYSSYEPKNAKFFRLAEKEVIEEYYKNSNLIVTHGGIGSIINALTNDKKIIVMPRKRKYGEIIDDHQEQLCLRLEKENKIVVAWESTDLKLLINFSANKPNYIKDMALINHIKNYLGELENELYDYNAR